MLRVTFYKVLIYVRILHIHDIFTNVYVYTFYKILIYVYIWCVWAYIIIALLNILVDLLFDRCIPIIICH